jgi:hypothetical protein
LLFSFVGGATLSSNRALRALRAQQNPVRIRRQSRLGARSQAAGRANIRQRRNSGIRLQCILIKKMPIGIFRLRIGNEPFPGAFSTSLYLTSNKKYGIIKIQITKRS